MNALKQLETYGQAPWLDFVSRSLLAKGELKKMVETDGLKGVTSNPSIFQKAIGGSADYDDALKSFLGAGDRGVKAIYEHLAIGDIREAADVLAPVYAALQGADGFISLEVSPYLANDTEGTIAEARRLWKEVGKPNLMVKVPGTASGVPAIRTLIGDGININVTLLFSITAYEAVAEAYTAGLEAFVAGGGDASKVASVASFFVSRIDGAVDKALDGCIERGGDRADLDAMRGKVAIANAKLAFERSKTLFAGPRWEALAGKGARIQRLLWASTGTKSKSLPDTLYVDTLIGRDTVNTMPPQTMDAFRDHGRPAPDTIESDLDSARAVLAKLKQLDISLDGITSKLVDDGVKLFADAFDALLGAVAGKRAKFITERSHSAQAITPAGKPLEEAIAKETEKWRADAGVRRLWAQDKSLWTGSDEDRWMGWLDIVDRSLADVAELQKFAGDVQAQAYAHVVLLGMGGSSLGPEVLSRTFGGIRGAPEFHMLDSTDPAQVAAVEAAIDLPKTLFIVSSKSGSTLEPNIFEEYFFARLSKILGAEAAGARFVAVTDPGSAMEKRARERGFGHLFHGVPSIGGRYSVLSNFGLVPAAALGIDIPAFLECTREMVHSCGEDVPPAENPGVELGILLGLAARGFKRDKVTIVTSPGVAALGAWLEQLIAESTGKNGLGLIPLDGEPLAGPEAYGRDRVFVNVRLAGDAEQEASARLDALAVAGHPVVRITVADAAHIGQEFFRWEIATAVAGSIIGINPFDQPDVEASKKKTQSLTKDFESSGALPPETPLFQADGVLLFADAANTAALGRHDSFEGYVRAHFERAGPGDYIALLAYIERNQAHTSVLQGMRVRLRDERHCATAVGFGPRFLHSTGQAYKGGPPSGVFLQITCDDASDLPIPGHRFSFGVVKSAQARGDFEVLSERKRRALRIHFKDPAAGLALLSKALARPAEPAHA